ncbi:MAG: hypothetical protein ACOC6C_01280 [Verrucomicrobiota bacterium]
MRQTLNDLKPSAYSGRLQVLAFPVDGPVCHYDEGYVFDANVRVFDKKGLPVRRLDRKNFDFSIDGRHGRSGLTAASEGYRVRRAFHDIPLGVDILLNSNPATLLYAASGNTEGRIIKWLRKFVDGLDVNKMVRIYIADGSDASLVGRARLNATVGLTEELVSKVSNAADEGRFDECRDLGPVARQLGSDYSFAGKNINHKPEPRLLLLVSTPDKFGESVDNVCSNLVAKQLAVGLVPVDGEYHGKTAQALPSDPRRARRAAEVLLARVAPFYRMQVRLHPLRMEPDGLTHGFVVKAATDNAYGQSDELPFSVKAEDFTPTWLKIVVVGGVVIVLMILIFGISMIVVAFRESPQEETPEGYGNEVS